MANAMPRSDEQEGASRERSVRGSVAVAPSEEFFDEVFREFGPFVWRALRRLGVRAADAEDVAQEVFVIVHRKLDTFEGRGTLRSFVYGITVRVASDYRRKARIRREVIDGPVEPDPSDGPNCPPQERATRQREARALLDELLQTLDPPKREVFVLYEIEELPMKEVAASLRITSATGYARLAAARRRLKQALRRRTASEGTS
ncbi:MAG: sigma-70 family RNA polymerase sigma factor [Myxococcota bacterium]